MQCQVKLADFIPADLSIIASSGSLRTPSPCRGTCHIRKRSLVRASPVQGVILTCSYLQSALGMRCRAPVWCSFGGPGRGCSCHRATLRLPSVDSQWRPLTRAPGTPKFRACSQICAPYGTPVVVCARGTVLVAQTKGQAPWTSSMPQGGCVCGVGGLPRFLPLHLSPCCARPCTQGSLPAARVDCRHWAETKRPQWCANAPIELCQLSVRVQSPGRAEKTRSGRL